LGIAKSSTAFVNGLRHLPDRPFHTKDIGVASPGTRIAG
jgi:hypothetical protein